MMYMYIHIGLWFRVIDSHRKKTQTTNEVYIRNNEETEETTRDIVRNPRWEETERILED